VLPVTVRTVTEAAGADALVELDSGGDRLLARVTRRSATGLALAPGLPLWAIVKAVAFDRGTMPGRTPATGPAPAGPDARS
jgi:molybdate transport system ATP-binding protein